MGWCVQSSKSQADEELDGRTGRGKMGGTRRAGRSGLARGANVGGKFKGEGASEALCTRGGRWVEQPGEISADSESCAGSLGQAPNTLAAAIRHPLYPHALKSRGCLSARAAFE
jgi:hypothetical protein